MERLKIWVYVLLFAALILVNNSTVEAKGCCCGWCAWYKGIDNMVAYKCQSSTGQMISCYAVLDQTIEKYKKCTVWYDSLCSCGLEANTQWDLDSEFIVVQYPTSSILYFSSPECKQCWNASLYEQGGWSFIVVKCGPGMTRFTGGCSSCP